ncbi:hypothetical protein DPMN_097065, partial [Dreissena polymorpha]
MSDPVGKVSPVRVRPESDGHQTVFDVASPTTSEDLDHLKALDEQKKRREQEPLRFCRLVAEYPVRAFLLALSVHMLMVVISVILLVSGYDLLPVDFENLPLEVNDQPWRPRDLAWTHKNEIEGYYSRTPTASYRQNTYTRADIFLIYDGEGSNIFTKAKLQKIQSIENAITSVPKYKNSYCQLNVFKTACEKPLSIIRFFDGSFSMLSPVFNDPNFDNINAVTYEGTTNNFTAGFFRFFLGKSAEVKAGSAFSTVTRSRIPLGYPLEGYKSDKDYEQHIRDWTAADVKPILVDARDSTQEFDFSYMSQLLWIEDVLKMALQDVIFVVGSIFFIFALILFHTRSLWISGFAILSIVTSFIGTNLIYTVVIGFKYIGFFHVLTLFIVLGIGADDIFVFYDVWRNTAYDQYPSLAHRLSDAFRKSVFSMLFTSLTTAVAFFATAISPLLATRSFGVFSGLVVTLNYISVILYFPTVVVLYHVKFEHFQWPCIKFCKKHCKCFRCCESKNISEVESISTEPERKSSKFFKSNMIGSLQDNTASIGVVENGRGYMTEISINNPNLNKLDSEKTMSNGFDNETTNEQLGNSKNENGNVSNGHTNKAFENDINDKHEKPKSDKTLPDNAAKDEQVKRYNKKMKQKSSLVLFFRNKYSWFVTHKIFRWVILAVLLGVLVFFIVQASKLEPDNEGFKVLKDSHVYSIAAKHLQESFTISDEDSTITIYIVWGLLQNDMSGCHFSTPECKGEHRWDANFNPSTHAAQTAMNALCDRMLSFTKKEAEDFHIKSDYTTGKLQINCYMRNLDTFLQAESANTSVDWNINYDYNKALSFMTSRNTFYNTTGFDNNYKHFLEVPISYWLTNKYTFDYQSDFYLFNHLIGEQTGDYTQTLLTDNKTKYGNNIRYVAIQVNTTLKGQTLGYAKGIPIKDKWEEFVNAEMAKMPAEMANGFQVVEQMWHWLIISKMLADNAVWGIVIGVCLAFPILVLATGNLITGSLATFSMCCSTICVVGVVPLGGWKLG